MARLRAGMANGAWLRAVCMATLTMACPATAVAAAIDAPAAASAPAPTPEATPTPAPAPAHAEAITVTARKRAEDVQQVPIAITVRTEDQLDEAGVEDLADLQSTTPNLTLFAARNQSTTL